jgi:hypothetical protein
MGYDGREPIASAEELALARVFGQLTAAVRLVDLALRELKGR